VFKPVLAKGDFARRYRLGEFGNASPTWESLEAFQRDSPDEGLYHLRNGRVAGGVTYYKQTPAQVVERWGGVSDPSAWYCSQQVPLGVEQSLRLQGEVMRTERGLYLYYSTVPLPMRDALRQRAESVYGIMAGLLLRDALCWNSYEWLGVLLDRYPDHVVEFSTYGIPWGTLPHYNTIFWEVRLY